MADHDVTEFRVTHGLFVLSQCGVNHAHVEEDLGCVGNWLEILQCLVELIVVVPRKGGDPAFYFLNGLSANAAISSLGQSVTNLFERHDCSKLHSVPCGERNRGRRSCAIDERLRPRARAARSVLQAA